MAFADPGGDRRQRYARGRRIRLIELADQRMYMAKQAGRHRWIDSELTAAEFIPIAQPLAPAA